MTLIALIAASWVALSVVTALLFCVAAGAIKRSGPALPLPAAGHPGAAATLPVLAPGTPVSLPAPRRASTPALSA